MNNHSHVLYISKWFLCHTYTYIKTSNLLDLIYYKITYHWCLARTEFYHTLYMYFTIIMLIVTYFPSHSCNFVASHTDIFYTTSRLQNYISFAPDYEKCRILSYFTKSIPVPTLRLPLSAWPFTSVTAWDNQSTDMFCGPANRASTSGCQESHPQQSNQNILDSSQ